MSLIFSESYLQWRKCRSWSWASFRAFMADLAEALKHGWNVSLPHSSSRRDVPLCECVWVCEYTHRPSLSPAAKAQLHHVALCIIQSRWGKERASMLCGKHIFKEENLVLRVGAHRLTPCPFWAANESFVTEKCKNPPYSEQKLE